MTLDETIATCRAYINDRRSEPEARPHELAVAVTVLADEVEILRAEVEYYLTDYKRRAQ